MTRLLVHVEGETEETFVNEVLAQHLYDHGFSKVSARLFGNPRQRIRRGGIRPWADVRKDIVNHLKEDQAGVTAIMVDYYGLPKVGSRAWPGRFHASGNPFPMKAKTVEDALFKDISQAIGVKASQKRARFVPYVMMHEFEAMLFSDCDGFGRGIGHPDLGPRFQEIRDEFSSPEEIDDSPATAPSKRIVELVPEYQKPIMGTLAVLEIGLSAIRDACPHFRSWLGHLEKLPACRNT